MYRYEYIPRCRVDIFHTKCLIPDTVSDFVSCPHHVQTGYEANPAFYSMCSGAVSTEIKQPARETESPSL